jgi:UDP-N-acetylglucosamine--N-acetylmuramyl-(pentapeptide) pyrophosphoryl-undecaprenol N-acetylglucosamine transferase
MTFVIAAAGTGGHVFPGLSVGEALVDRGVSPEEILFVGGDRLEAKVYPEAGFPFLQVEIRGLQRSLNTRNLSLPAVVRRARARVMATMGERGTRAVLGMGGYVSVPVAMAARTLRIPYFNSEQNANAGLASRLTSRWARKTFVSFPDTVGLEGAEWVGNPVRRPFWEFHRTALRPEALARYGLDDGPPVLGVFGGSLGSGVINQAVAAMLENWAGPTIQVIHITGERFHQAEPAMTLDHAHLVTVAFENEMEWFYAASDLVLARAGGAVAELTATATPAVLVPGDFGSGGHQVDNARFLVHAGAAVMVTERELDGLPQVISKMLLDPDMLEQMQEAATLIARPLAARVIADHLIEAAS